MSFNTIPKNKILVKFFDFTVSNSISATSDFPPVNNVQFHYQHGFNVWMKNSVDPDQLDSNGAN